MTNYIYNSVTKIGPNHIKKNTKCEDYSLHYVDKNYGIIAIADGHGQDISFRSNIGSKYAAEISKEALLTFGQEVQLEDLQKDKERLVRQLIKSIIGTWLIKCEDHFKKNPLNEQEKILAGDHLFDLESDIRTEVVYGTTLLSTLITKDYMLVIHQGDGRCVIIHENGTIDQPVPWDPNCFQNYVTSLCNEDAFLKTRYFLQDLNEDNIIACFNMSDGVEESFTNLEVLNAVCGYYAKTLTEVDNDKPVLKEIIDELDRIGKDDDKSLAYFIDRQRIKRHYDLLSMRFELTKQKENKNRIYNKIQSKQRKKLYLEKQVEQSRDTVESIIKEIESIEKKINGKSSILIKIKSKIKELDKEKRTLLEKKEKALLNEEDFTLAYQAFIEDYNNLEKDYEESQKLIEYTNNKIQSLSEK